MTPYLVHPLDIDFDRPTLIAVIKKLIMTTFCTYKEAISDIPLSGEFPVIGEPR
jgi:hypothetical protein